VEELIYYVGEPQVIWDWVFLLLNLGCLMISLGLVFGCGFPPTPARHWGAGGCGFHCRECMRWRCSISLMRCGRGKGGWLWERVLGFMWYDEEPVNGNFPLYVADTSVVPSVLWMLLIYALH